MDRRRDGETMTASAQSRPFLGTPHTEFLRAVEAALAQRLAKLAREFQDYAPESPALGGHDLVSLLGTQVHSGGKRLRPTMAWLGWCYAGGSAWCPAARSSSAACRAVKNVRAV